MSEPPLLRLSYYHSSRCNRVQSYIKLSLMRFAFPIQVKARSQFILTLSCKLCGTSGFSDTGSLFPKTACSTLFNITHKSHSILQESAIKLPIGTSLRGSTASSRHVSNISFFPFFFFSVCAKPIRFMRPIVQCTFPLARF